MKKSTAVLLQLGHLLDHHFLLIAAACAGFIAKDFGLTDWTQVIPYTAGAFLLFGFASIPSGRLGDQWGRRNMMLVFYFGLGVSALVVAATQTAVQFAIALTVLGIFSSIYHPVGIPMLLANAKQPGKTIGVNGLAGNMGLATAAVVTAWLSTYLGWRWAFIVPGLLCIAIGIVFSFVAEQEKLAPAKQKVTLTQVSPELARRAFLIITLTATTGSLLFNFTTNGNYELLNERLGHLIADPAKIGTLLAIIMALASLTQLIMGQLIDKYPVRTLFRAVILFQITAFIFAWQAQGWIFGIALFLYMVGVFAAIPFSDFLITRFIDDSMRSRMSGVRIGASFGVGSLAVLALGPLVKQAGFATLLIGLAGVALLTFISLFWLPETHSH